MFADPEKNIEQFGLSDGMIVADLGAGSGHYSFAAAKAVSPGGKVYAVEVQKDLLEKLKQEAHREGLLNIEAIWSDIDEPKGSKLADASVHSVIASNILFQLEEKEVFTREVNRILQSNGRVLVVDWSESFGGLGPHSDAVFTKAKARDLFLRLGFVEDKEIEAGAHHYGIIFKKKSNV